MQIFNWRKSNPEKRRLYFKSLRDIARDLASVKASVNTLKTAQDELIDDHATFKAAVDELKTWAETLGAKLNLDAGVTDTDYDDSIAHAAPATLTASKSTALGTLNTTEG